MPGIHPGVAAFSDQDFVIDHLFFHETIEFHRLFVQEVFLTNPYPQELQLLIGRLGIFG